MAEQAHLDAIDATQKTIGEVPMAGLYSDLSIHLTPQHEARLLSSIYRRSSNGPSLREALPLDVQLATGSGLVVAPRHAQRDVDPRLDFSYRVSE